MQLPWFSASSVNSAISFKYNEVLDVKYYFDRAWRVCQRHGKSNEANCDKICCSSGEQSQFIAIDFPETSSTALLTSQLEEAIAQLDCEDGIVFLTDLLGGTPFRVASTLAMQKPGCEVITGTNLQLLLEMVLEREGLSGEEFRVQALECGHRGLTSLVDELGRCHEECPVEEGI